jgi:hypothetical protein
LSPLFSLLVNMFIDSCVFQYSTPPLANGREMKKNWCKLILGILKDHPEGLSLTDLAGLLSCHRHTITKYVYELHGAKKIIERQVGMAKLYYLPAHYPNNANNNTNALSKKGQSQVLAAMIFLLLVPGIMLAENVTNSTTLANETTDLCADVVCEDSVTTCPDGFIATCQNICDPATGVCSICEPDCTGHEAVNLTNQTEEDTNETGETQPELSIGLTHETKITRGEVFEVTATVTNTGLGSAINVLLSWELPSEFSIISGGETKSCGTLEPGSACVSAISVLSTKVSTLGPNEIKVVVSYD